ncbi:hypothetical protein BDV38DRAFT_245443 [Aspergillus pseudotamarii]|uniref:Uncharacterized protein n=1 Tax=Aspergillus pseudotamarii TaxID=132259 RepID=A0A5N6SWA6_ASPPS|nr:uncharacterized protein BDV38DRAFT_245443 [Aspergillus pseudotamarii]KAE8138089.1 hypothetical protein BDV38DRAFT_245443 [Aspergillus pseudotamarii]
MTSFREQGSPLAPLCLGQCQNCTPSNWPFSRDSSYSPSSISPVALVYGLQTVMVCRFLVRSSSTDPLDTARGTLADISNHIKHGAAVLIFTSATFVGSMRR